MTTACETIRATLTAAVAGRFDELAAEQVAALEAHLAACPGCAAELAACKPARDPVLTTAVRVAGEGPRPTAAAWEALYRDIEARVVATPALPRRAPAVFAAARTQRPIPAALLRWWRPLAAAAAVLLAVGVWRLERPNPVPADSFELATNVEINSLEAGPDTTVYTSEGGAVIWVIDNGA
jgi:anti-sigma factor RsiW